MSMSDYPAGRCTAVPIPPEAGTVEVPRRHRESHVFVTAAGASARHHRRGRSQALRGLAIAPLTAPHQLPSVVAQPFSTPQCRWAKDVAGMERDQRYTPPRQMRRPREIRRQPAGRDSKHERSRRTDTFAHPRERVYCTQSTVQGRAEVSASPQHATFIVETRQGALPIIIRTEPSEVART